MPAKMTKERFLTYVRVSPLGCWEWLGSMHANGYGHCCLLIGGKVETQAHRAAYLLFSGPIPAGLQLDHLCRNRVCVNPAHLEPVTSRENNLRSDNLAGRHAKQTHCKRGHPFDEANTYRRPYKDRWQRICRACVNAGHNRANARRRAAA